MAVYTVKSGDNLSKIASKYGINWRELYNTNKSVIGSNPNLIRPGQTFNIPGTQAAATPQAQAAAPTESPGTIAGKQAGEAAALTPFSDVLSFDSYFNPELARGTAEQTAAAYYAPIAQKQRELLESQFAGRGLIRSGLRGAGVQDLYKGIGGEQQQEIESDFLEQKGNARQEYSGLQELYENTEGKQKPQSAAYKPYEVKQPTTAAGKYGTTYLNWLNKATR